MGNGPDSIGGRGASALACFVSPTSLESRSVEAELVAFAEAGDRLVVPVLIGGTGFDQLPPSLADYQAVVLDDQTEIDDVALNIAEIVTSSVRVPAPRSNESDYRASRLSSDLAADLRNPAASVADPESEHSVFLVHGHDHAFREEVETHLDQLGIRPVVLSKVGGPSRSLFQKFETLARKARFAIVLLSADDFGASRSQYEHVDLGGTKTLKYRARENVILELGFFYGRLGWERVFVVAKPAPEVWPDFERPSDLAGIVFVEAATEYDWRFELTSSLVGAGLASSDESNRPPPVDVE